MRAQPPPEDFDEEALWRKLRGLPAQVVARAMALYAILADGATPAWARAIVAAALVYLIAPVDAVPDFLAGGLGLADDFAVMGLALSRVSRLLRRDP